MTSEQADFVETGKRSADSLLAVINDILDFSKIEAGKLDIEIIEQKVLELFLSVADKTRLELQQFVQHDNH